MVGEGERLKTAKEIGMDPKGASRSETLYTKDGFDLKKPAVSETDRVGFDLKKLEEEIAEKGNQYLSHFIMDGKMVVFVLYNDKKESGTFVLQDDGGTRRPTTEEWAAHKTYYGMAGGDVKKLDSDDWEG